MTHPEPISKVLHILGIITNHIATSQFATIKSQVTDVCMIQKKHIEKRDLSGNWLKVCCHHFWSIWFKEDFPEKILLCQAYPHVGSYHHIKFQIKANERVPKNLPEGGRKDGSYFIGPFHWKAGVQFEKDQKLVIHQEETITLWKTESNEITK